MSWSSPFSAPPWPASSKPLQTELGCLLLNKMPLFEFVSYSQHHNLQYPGHICKFAACLGKITNSALRYFHKRRTKGPWPPSPWESALITTMLQLKTRPLWGHSYFHQKVCRFKFTQLPCTLVLSRNQWNGSKEKFSDIRCQLCNRKAHPLLC